MAKPIYSTSVQIPMFSGLNQSGDGYNKNMQYAWEMENVNVEGGTFRPMRNGIKIPQELNKPIGTLAYIYRRYIANPDTLLVAISNGRVFTKKLDGTDDWAQRFPPLVNTAGEGEDPVYEESGDPLTTSDCDCVTYEANTYPVFDEDETYSVGQRVIKIDKIYKAKQKISPADSSWTPSHWEEIVDPDTTDYPVYEKKKYKKGAIVKKTADKNYKCIASTENDTEWVAAHWEQITGADPVDVLLFTNASDGMFCLYGDDLSIAPVKTPKKFGVLARYNERIWGAGIENDPDMLVYSAPYTPFDWAGNADIPEDGGGDISQPSWDGDRFVALKQYGSNLLAVKQNSIWRIYGTSPSDFTMQQQYGNGTIEENTIVCYNDVAFMLGRKGLMRYDGSGAYPFLQEEIKEIFNKANHSAFNTTCAAICGKTYYLALPLEDSEYCNSILEYNTSERSIALRTGVTVDSFLQINGRLFYTSATEPGQVFELNDSTGNPLPCKWVSCWQDLGLKNSIKSAFVAYMMVESESPVELRVGIRTEKKLKQKTIFTKPKKMTRLHLNLQGRTFRLEIHSFSAIPFTIAGGVRIDLELDPD